MQINRKNYEIWFLDYYEERLAPGEVAMLMVFLEDNPDLKSEFDSFEKITFEPETAFTYRDKQKLTKPEYKATGDIDAWNYETKMAAFLEGDLTQDESRTLQKFTQINPAARLELNMFRKTILEPPAIEYTEKDSLKKKGLFVLYRRQTILTIASMAAMILLFFGIYSVLNRTVVTHDPSVDKLPLLQTKKIEQIGTGNLMIPVTEIREMSLLTNITEESMVEDSFEKTMALQTIEGITIQTIDLGGFELPGQINSIAALTGIDQTPGLYVPEPETIERSFVARFVAGFVRKIIGDPASEDKTLVEYTVEGYNLIADREVEVNKQLDRNGNIVSYDINGQVISFSRNRNSQP